MTDHLAQPVIGITCDLADDRYRAGRGYSDMVVRAGGIPILLPCCVDRLAAYLDLCCGFLLTGGDDPIMEDWGVPTHPKATPVHAERQAFERALLQALDQRPDVPLLGVCLGMQFMALESGGTLDQHLPDTHDTAPMHWGRQLHAVEGAIGTGDVQSHHRQAITDPGRYEVTGRAEDGVIEAIRDPRRAYGVGVQWHPERSGDGPLGAGIVAEFVAAAARSRVGATAQFA